MTQLSVELQTLPGFAQSLELGSLHYGLLLHERVVIDGTRTQEWFEFVSFLDGGNGPIRLRGVEPDDSRNFRERGEETEFDLRMVRPSAMRLECAPPSPFGRPTLQRAFVVVAARSHPISRRIGLNLHVTTADGELQQVVCSDAGPAPMLLWSSDEWRSAPLPQAPAESDDLTHCLARWRQQAEEVIAGHERKRSSAVAEQKAAAAVAERARRRSTEPPPPPSPPSAVTGTGFDPAAAAITRQTTTPLNPPPQNSASWGLVSVLLFVVGIGYVWHISTKKEESPAVTTAPAPSPSVVVPTPSSAQARPRVTVQTPPPKPAPEPVREANAPVEPAATAREPIAVAAPAASDDKAQLARNLTSSHDTAGLNARVAIINMALADAAGSNNSEVAQVIAAGLAGDDRATYDLARSAIRNRTFAARFDDWRRLRTEARPINEETLASYRSNLAEAKQRESVAVALDPFDQEIAGNLGLYFALDGKAQLASNLAIYNLALRPPNSTGRSADWHLLATALALQGKLRDSEGAFFVGLAISTNLSGLCRSLLVQQAQFGDVLKEPITSVFRRIAERGNSATDGCAYPPVWRN